jgi:glycosyltransferase involved in cell wall biosynthesis
LKLRQWDYYAAQNADLLLANSVNTASRVEKYHRRKAEILYPPVETERFATKLSQTCDTNKEYYIIISALTEFKKIEIAIEAFNNIPENKLMIVGAGNYENQLQEMSQKNIEFTGAQYGNDLVEIVQGSLGLIFP